MLNQRTGHEPDHFVEKTFALDLQRDAFGPSFQRDRINRPPGIEWFRSPIGRKRGKVMPAGEKSGRGGHSFAIDRRDHMPGAPEFMWRQDRPGPNPVTINFCPGRKARMKIGRHAPALQDANGRRQDGVERGRPLRQRQTVLRKIDMRALRKRVHSGIGASRSMHANRRPLDAFERALEMVLNPVAIRLTLPARKGRAVISNDQFQPLHTLAGCRQFVRVLPIEKSLQDHLRRDLVDVTARGPRFFSGFAQGAFRCNRSQALIPGNNLARQSPP
jgi:hypothetical protein